MSAHSIESEQSVLGALMLSNSAWDLIDGRVSDTDFYREDHRIIFRIIGDLLKANKAADVLTVAERLKAADELKNIGFDYLQSLESATPSAANIRQYAEIVRQKAVVRKLVEVCSGAAEQATGTAEPSQLIDAVQQQLSKLLEGEASDDLKGFVDLLPDYLEMQEQRKSGRTYELKSHLRELDSKIGGFDEGDLVIVGARPAMGKSGFMLHLADANASMDYPVMVISLEMQASALKDRLVAKRANVPLDVVLGKKSRTREQHNAIVNTANSMVHVPIRFGDMMTMNIQRLRAMVRRAKRKYGIRMVFLDYLQLMEGAGEDMRAEQIATITRGLKTLAVEMKMPIVALAQLNRKLEERHNKRPQLSDLRESGSIEQDADMIFFLYRDEVYHEGSPDTGTVEVIVGKQRQGETGTVRARYDGALQAFTDLPQGYQPPARVAPVRKGFDVRNPMVGVA